MIPELAIWKRVREVALGALSVSREERSQFVRDECRGDRELQRAVETYLAISTREADAVEDLRFGVLEEPPALSEGTLIDSFRIVKVLGRGGMGMVYLAIDEQNDRHVALKILSTSARFNRGEHKILARLEDPFVARLYSSGWAPDEFPYLALEYVDGSPLVEYCESHLPSLKQRLVLFKKICEGVKAAHQNLIVHGDLTPKNILVTPKGEPKIVDFGIAREVRVEQLAGATDELRPMTPSFASPEQRRGEMIGATSDVYSLGVLLCVLVTGRHPFALDDEHRPVEPEEGPTPPSRLVESDRRLILPPPPVNAARLRKAISGDLDAILLKALHPALSERYPTAAELGEEIERYLARLPVSARRRTAGYRLRKLVRRRPWRLVAVLILLVMAALLVVQYQRAVRGEREAVAQAERARGINRFVVDLLRPANPYDESSSATASIDDLLNQASNSVVSGLDEYPDLKASLLSVLGEVVGARGDAAKGLDLLSKALELQRAGPRTVDLAETLLRYGRLRALLGALGESDQALAEADKVLSESGGGDDGVLRARIRLAQAANKINQADYESGRLLSEEALTLLEDSPGSLGELSTTFHALGRALESKGQNAEGERVFELGLSYAERIGDGRNAHVAALLNSLGTLRHKRADYASARELLARSAEIKRELFGEDGAEYAITLHNLAAVDAAEGQYEEAEAQFARVVGILQEELPPHHVRLLTAQDQWASMLVRLGKFDRAERILESVIALEEEHLSANDPLRGVSLNNLAYLNQERGDFGKAEELYLRAVDVFESLLGRQSRPVATLLGNLGYVAHNLGEVILAEERYQEALDISRGISDGRTAEGVVAASNLMSFYVSVGELTKARSLLEEVVSLADVVVGPDHWLMGSVHHTHARLLLVEGDAQGALSTGRQARAVFEASLPPGEWRLAATDSVLGAALGRIGETSEAERLLLYSLDELRRLKGDSALPTREARERVRLFYEHLGRAEEAAGYGASR